jgi:hypothetical protein
MVNRFQGKDEILPGNGRLFYGTSGKSCRKKAFSPGTIVLFVHTG